MDSILTIENDSKALIRSCSSFIEELKMVLNSIELSGTSSKFIEAKNYCYIQYILNGKEYTEYFGKVINNFFYYGANRVAQIEKDKVFLIISD